jgi:hypothetical protein
MADFRDETPGSQAFGHGKTRDLNIDWKRIKLSLEERKI